MPKGRQAAPTGLADAGRVLSLVLGLLAGCGDANDPPRTGTIRVSLTTTGVEIDADGYSVTVDGGAARSVAVNDSVTIPDVAPGPRTVRLEGLATNCSAGISGEQTLTVTAGQEATAAFTVACIARVTSIVVVITERGVDFDQDGYDVILDDGVSRVAGARLAVTLTAIGSGAHTVTLGGVAPNCVVDQPNPRSVEASGATVNVSFVVQCTARAGSVRVTTVTTGSEIDPDGYTANVGFDDYYYEFHIVASAPIGVHATVTLSGVSEGSYWIKLSGMSPNCAISAPASSPVAVAYADTVDVTINIVCAVTGTVQASVSTSGPDGDPDGFALHLESPGRRDSVQVLPGGSATLAQLNVGTYSARLGGVAENCAVEGTPTREVEVVAKATATIAFAVACTPVTRLAFVSERDGNQEIYTVNSNGTGLDRLTRNGASDLEPAWSPDGGTIAFASNRDQSVAFGPGDIYVMSADGSGATRLTNAGGWDRRPAWSPDGRRIAFVSERDGNDEIYVMAADGSEETRLTANGSSDVDPAWSPDGGRIAFTSYRDGGAHVYVMNADGSGATKLTSATNVATAYTTPAWSPDGQRIAFVKSCLEYYGCPSTEFEFVSEVYVVAADGSGGTATRLHAYSFAPSWSPDGRTIAFTTSDCAAACRIAIGYARVDGSYVGQILLNGHDPAWRP